MGKKVLLPKELRGLQEISRKYFNEIKIKELVSEGRVKTTLKRATQEELHVVTYLDLHEINLEEIPEEIKYFRYVKELDLSYN